MANTDQRLKQKSSNAKTSEYFVFLPNNLTDINSTLNVVDGHPMFCDAIAAKNAGNAFFEKDQYKDAVVQYNKAIDILEEKDSRSCAILLSVCYHNRATAKAYQRNYEDAIVDASKAIELNEHYPKAFYRRAMSYYAQKRCYRALQDILQACVLERFRNMLYTSAVIEIVAEIGRYTPSTPFQKILLNDIRFELLQLTFQTKILRLSSGERLTTKWTLYHCSAINA